MHDRPTSHDRLPVEAPQLQARIAALEAANTAAERALSELTTGRAILQATLECLPFEFFALGPDGRYIMENAVCRKNWGPVIGKTPAQVAPDANVLSLWQANNRRALAGEKIEEEAELVVNGEKRFFHSMVVPILEDGRIRGILGVNVDITRRKRDEEALRQARDELEQRVGERTAELAASNEALRRSEELHRKLVETSPHALIMADLEGRITFASRQGAELHGCEQVEELLGRCAVELIIPEDHQKFHDHLRHLLQNGGPREAEYTAIRKNGTRVAIEASGVTIPDPSGKPVAVMAILRDITERRRAEEAQRQSYEELRTIYEGMSEGLVIVDARTKQILRVNAALCRMLGYTEEELLAMPITGIHPAEQTALTLQRIGERANGTLQEHRNAVMLRKDGSTFYADVMGNPLTYGGRLCVLGLFRDITERRQARAAAERERQTLKHLLQSSDRERQLIAYEIHDGLAQQLAGAIMQLQTYDHLKNTNSKDAAKAFDAGMTMLRQGHFEARRMISGVRPPILDEEGIVAAVAHLVNEQRQVGPPITFQSEVAFGRLVPILENAIYRIVQEALANAGKHSRSPRIRLELVQVGDALRIKVQDWGVGFDPESVGEDRFGLSGIRERTRLLGGSVRIETAPGQGTCLTVELPLAPRE
jgi:PAS domain S-box-containing protein